MTEVDVLLSQARHAWDRRDFPLATQRVGETVRALGTDVSALGPQDRRWLQQARWFLSPMWSEPILHGTVSLRRCQRDDEGFFRSAFEDQAFASRFNRQRPWSGELGRALHKFGHEPPPLLKMLQWVACLRGEPVGLISLSHLDGANSRAEFSAGFPRDMSAGISHKACLLALHFAYFVAGLNKLCAYVYEDNTPAMQAAIRIGFRQEGFLVDHFHFQPEGFVSVHVLGLTRQQALETPNLVKAVARRTGNVWPSAQTVRTEGRSQRLKV